MNKKGFIFIETIVTVVVLAASLLMLYNSFSSSIENEKDRLNYDDIAYVYKANQVRKFLYGNTNINNLKKYALNNTYMITIGSGYIGGFNVNDIMFTNEQIAKEMQYTLEMIVSNMNINQMLLVNTDYFLNCFEENELCQKSTANISDGLKAYLKSINNKTGDYYLVIEFSEKNENNKMVKCFPSMDYNCQSYYAYLEI